MTIATLPIPTSIPLLRHGERMGRAEFERRYDAMPDTKAAIKRFTSLFEPMVILVMGLIVGALILSMLLAITSINDVAM